MHWTGHDSLLVGWALVGIAVIVGILLILPLSLIV
jgi:hypothetical protein